MLTVRFSGSASYFRPVRAGRLIPRRFIDSAGRSSTVVVRGGRVLAVISFAHPHPRCRRTDPQLASSSNFFRERQRSAFVPARRRSGAVHAGSRRSADPPLIGGGRAAPHVALEVLGQLWRVPGSRQRAVGESSGTALPPPAGDLARCVSVRPANRRPTTRAHRVKPAPPTTRGPPNIREPRRSLVPSN
jgi:hypothetical protein